MVIVDPSPAFLADPFITNIVAGLSNGLADQGYNLVLTRTELGRLEHTNVLRSSGTDGICVMLSGPRAERLGCLERIAGARGARRRVPGAADATSRRRVRDPPGRSRRRARARANASSARGRGGS